LTLLRKIVKRNFTILSLIPLAILSVVFVWLFGLLFESMSQKQPVSSGNLRSFIPAHQMVVETYKTCMERRPAPDRKWCVLAIQQIADASVKHRNQPDFPQQVNAALVDLGLLEKSPVQANNF
jgi:hypothetical protein